MTRIKSDISYKSLTARLPKMFVPLIFFSIFGAPLHSVAANFCSDLFVDSRSELKVDEEEGVFVRGILVTNHSYELVRESLGIDSALINRLKSSAGITLSIGEGASGLVPGLRSDGVNAKGVDLWYHQSDLLKLSTDRGITSHDLAEMKQYHEKNKDHLIRGDALNLNIVPESIPFVFSHKLANNFHIADQMRFFSEVVKVLDVGGEARIDLTPVGWFDNEYTREQNYHTAIRNFFQENYGNRVQVEIDGLSSLLTLKKSSSTKNTVTINNPYRPDRVYLYLPPGDLTIPFKSLPESTRRRRY